MDIPSGNLSARSFAADPLIAGHDLDAPEERYMEAEDEAYPMEDNEYESESDGEVADNEEGGIQWTRFVFWVSLLALLIIAGYLVFWYNNETQATKVRQEILDIKDNISRVISKQSRLKDGLIRDGDDERAWQSTVVALNTSNPTSRLSDVQELP